jgi:hypothetical protein
LYSNLFNKEQNSYFLFILARGFISLKIIFAQTLIWGSGGGKRKLEDTYETFLKLPADMRTNTHNLKQKKTPKIKRYSGSFSSGCVFATRTGR